MNARFLTALLLAASLSVPGFAAAGLVDPTLVPEDAVIGTNLFDGLKGGIMAMGRDDNGDLVMLSVPPRAEEEQRDLLLGPIIIEPRVRLF
jgi:hypothetical protein